MFSFQTTKLTEQLKSKAFILSQSLISSLVSTTNAKQLSDSDENAFKNQVTELNAIKNVIIKLQEFQRELNNDETLHIAVAEIRYFIRVRKWYLFQA